MISRRIESRSKQAFTLIELLVVIAIIAILAAILFPVFAQAREKARAITCLSNSKQQGLAILMYAQDYDEMIVPWINGVRTTNLWTPAYDQELNQRLWVGKLQPYLKLGLGWGTSGLNAKGAFACPSWNLANILKAADRADCDGDGSVGSSGLQNWFTPTAPDYPHVYAGFGINFYMGCLQSLSTGACWGPGNTGCGTSDDPCGYFAGSSGKNSRAMPEVQRPAETAITGDDLTVASPSFGGVGIAFGCESQYLHQNGGNFTFLDGHSKHLIGNSQRYESKRASDGMIYSTYHTLSE